LGPIKGFIRISEWASALKARGLAEDIANRAIEMRLVPTYSENNIRMIWEDDLAAVPIFWSEVPGPGQLPFPSSPGKSINNHFCWNRLRFANGIEVTLPPNRKSICIQSIAPTLRAIARMESNSSLSNLQEVELPNGIRVTVSGPDLLLRVLKISERMKRVLTDQALELTKSAYYMGSKYALSSFLVEGIAGVLPENGVVVDLMSGSGAATRAFSLNWSVLACDAMSFCSCLARCFGQQEGNGTVLNVLPQLHAAFLQNMETLEAAVSELASEEDKLLLSSLGFETGLGERYAEFVERTPRVPEGGSVHGWSPVKEVQLRRMPGQTQRAPYCLMLSYFSNVYFGLRQAMELDSIRFAIDQLENNHFRQMAFAAAVATASYIGTGYASQFAQPINIRGLSRRRLFSLLERRAIRVMPEFFARLSALSRVAEEALHPVFSFTGPWEESLKRVPSFSAGRPTCIYLDAPYTRDEYARYYHVLETFRRYHYPDAIGRGRTPNRKTDQIFRSPFFTRKDSAIGPLLSDIIVESLRYADFCAWSYSSCARASIPTVVQSVVERGGALVESFSIGHRYNGQGRSEHRSNKSERVEEYLLIFRRNTIEAAA